MTSSFLFQIRDPQLTICRPLNNVLRNLEKKANIVLSKAKNYANYVKNIGHVSIDLGVESISIDFSLFFPYEN